MIPPELIRHLERVVHDALAHWPAEWIRFHWPGYTYHHTSRVRCLACRLGQEEGADLEVLDLAALLHDVAKPQGEHHAAAGAEQARALLAGQLPEDLVERVTRTIAAHVGSKPGDPIECRVLFDADLIDANYGLVAITRYLTIRGSQGLSLDDVLRDISGWEARHVAMLERLTTSAGRRCADRRLTVMSRFCEELHADRVARALAGFFLSDSARPSLVRQAELLGRQGVPGATVEETRPFLTRLLREMNGEL